MQNQNDRLKAGETVSFCPHGNSMTPRVYSGQLVPGAPVLGADADVGDIVFCKVRGRKFLHLGTARKGKLLQISNNHGHCNGWTLEKHVYGRLIGVAPLPPAIAP
jgi:hypothetical protein